MSSTEGVVKMRKFPVRVRAACASCSKKKIRCDGVKAGCNQCETRKIECIYLVEGNHSKKRETSLDGRRSKSSTVESPESTISPAKRPSLVESRSNSYSHPIVPTNYGPILPLPSPSLYSPLALDSTSFPLPFQQSLPLQDPLQMYPFPADYTYQQTPYPAQSSSYPNPHPNNPFSNPQIDQLSPEQLTNPSLPQALDPNRPDLWQSGEVRKPSKKVQETSSKSSASLAPGPAANPVKPIVKQPFFRWLGTTAILPPKNSLFLQHEVEIETSAPKSSKRPGLRKSFGSSAAISFTALSNLPSTAFEFSRDRPANSTSTTRSNSPTSSGFGGHSGFRLPPRSIIPIFYQNCGNFIPFLSQEDFESRVDDETVSELLFNAMAAIAERVLPTPGSINLAEVYADRAKSLLVPQLGLPNLSMITSAVLLAYHEFGQDRDSGLWAYTGIAIRASTDLGLNWPFSGVESQFAGDESSPELRSRVFWSIFCLDRLISSGTGRQTSIPTETIEIAFPPPRAIFLPTGEILTDPFPYLAKILLILGKVTDLINQHCRPQQSDFLPENSPFSDVDTAADNSRLHQALTPFQAVINDFYVTLPPDLVFTVHNFKNYSTANHAQCFLLLSIWFQATYLSIHHSSVLYTKSNSHQEAVYPDERARASATSSALSISDMLTFADLVQPNSFLSCPFLAQALLMAGCASATSVRASNYNDVASSRSVNICKDGLGRLTEKWSGVEWIDSAMEALIVDSMESDMPSTTTSAGKIKSKDRGLINRAKLDDLTRSWLEKALGTSAMGVSVTGQLDEVSWMDGDFVFRDAFAPTASVNELFNYTGSN